MYPRLPDLTIALATSQIRRLRLVISVRDEFYLSDFGLGVIGNIVSRISSLEELVLDQVQTWKHVPLLEDAFVRSSLCYIPYSVLFGVGGLDRSHPSLSETSCPDDVCRLRGSFHRHFGRLQR